MRKYSVFPFLFTINTVISQDLELPTCWLHYGECLDQNQPPLNIKDKQKPLNNENVIAVEKDILTIEDCNRKCEENAQCEYYTLYKNDLNKACQIVGFNLGHACNYLSNVCVLLKQCNSFDSTCDKGCVTGRRFLKDVSKQYKTLVVGGVKDKRLKWNEYETSVEVVNEFGETKCPVYSDKTLEREGAAGAFFDDGSSQTALLCGGWITTSVNDSIPKQSFIKGTYFKSCEVMSKNQNWNKNWGRDMTRHRAFFSMAATDKRIYAFGGYNNYKGFLDHIEFMDMTANPLTWEEIPTTTLKLEEPKAHTCASTVKYMGDMFIAVVGGWNDMLEYVANVELFQVNDDGSLALNMTIEMPADRDDDMTRTKGRGDTACMEFRRNNWEDGLLVSGGYRDAGAWLNTAWWLNLTAVFNPSATALPWQRVTNISPMFDGGRHNHAMSTAAFMPIIIGGWRNKALENMLLMDECVQDDDATRFGGWTPQDSKLKIGREKFVSLVVPRSFLVGTDFCVDS